MGGVTNEQIQLLYQQFRKDLGEGQPRIAERGSFSIEGEDMDRHVHIALILPCRKETTVTASFMPSNVTIDVAVDDIEHLFFVKSFGSHMLTKFEHSLMLQGDFTLLRYNCFSDATVSFKSKLQFLE